MPGAAGARCPEIETAPQTPEGEAALEILEICSGQVRIAGPRPVALDYGAVMGFAAALGADTRAVAMFMPGFEAGMIRGLNKMIDGEGNGNDER